MPRPKLFRVETKLLTLQVPIDMWQELRRIAYENDVPRSVIVREFIADGLGTERPKCPALRGRRGDSDGEPENLSPRY
jgi:hypothetical protein